MEKSDHCFFEEIAIEGNKHINKDKLCLLKIFLNQKNLKAARGICERCGKIVTLGQFVGPSIGSLTVRDLPKES